ncbi:MAG: HNH endonuclease family protein [Micrococcales bacterium]
MRSLTASSRFFNWSARSPKQSRRAKRALSGVALALVLFQLGALGAFSASGAIGASAASFEGSAKDGVPAAQIGLHDPYTAKVSPVVSVLNKLSVKGRAPKTGYDRSLFGDGWGDIGYCDTRNYILKRDLTNITWRSGENCMVATGVLRDPYTGKVINFVRGVSTSLKVQIDHVVAVSDAWQKGAQQWSPSKRIQFYNDPLNLLAVDGPTNSAKGDSDAASWLPPNKAYRCPYVARQVAVKSKYGLWVTSAEKAAIASILAGCPTQQLPR